MIFTRIRRKAPPGTAIPKPLAGLRSKVKYYGTRRGRPALIYTMRNRRDPADPHLKGVTDREFQIAFRQLLSVGEVTRQWFNRRLPQCSSDGPCNFTTIGGIFQKLGIAFYKRQGVYGKVSRFSRRRA